MSYLQGGTVYDNVAYSDTVCSDMECVDIRNPNMCISKTADDGTPCGNKKVSVLFICPLTLFFSSNKNIHLS